ncbi:coenzyme F420-dependent NADP oxidoreductase [Knoellia subterranea KCTC 19937]|uniref:Coenzyme F420-dependent NADP oxidoreductase n=1 Tax=Knoellia subterranea KCTC 19937 TaxID=1385521 RepID=A0A0A0JRE2_9MICO|nr:coenzyme F420-dependent NADP oxidoreductase [Knoellia subterranea KCTC 19937]
MSIGVIGAGRVGSVLGAALQRAGHTIQAAYAVSADSRERADELLPGVPLRDVPEVIDGADLVLLAVPDDALPDLVSGLAATNTWQAGQIVVHTSGRHGAEVLRPALASHILPIALHPAMTFTGTALDLGRLEECAFGVTCPDALRPMAEALVVEMGGEPVWVAEADRAAYHAALAHGSNHLVTLIAEAMEVLTAAGVDEPRAVLGPLVRAALDNALRLGDGALTGPVARGDVSTVGTHLHELERISPEIRATYVALARATAVRALESGRLQPSAAEPLLDTLADQEPQ